MLVQMKMEIERKRDRWDETSTFILAGVSCMSFKDLDLLEHYLEHHEQGKSRDLRRPSGKIELLLIKSGINPDEFGRCQ